MRTAHLGRGLQVLTDNLTVLHECSCEAEQAALPDTQVCTLALNNAVEIVA